MSPHHRHRGFTSWHVETVLRDLSFIALFAILGFLVRDGLGVLFGSHGAFRGLISKRPLFPELACNSLGSFLMGVLITWQRHVHRLTAPSVYIGLTVGFCGSLTTFASWMVQALEELVRARVGSAIVILILGTWCGLASFVVGVHFCEMLELLAESCRRREDDQEQEEEPTPPTSDERETNGRGTGDGPKSSSELGGGAGKDEVDERKERWRATWKELLRGRAGGEEQVHVHNGEGQSHQTHHQHPHHLHDHRSSSFSSMDGVFEDFLDAVLVAEGQLSRTNEKEEEKEEGEGGEESQAAAAAAAPPVEVQGLDNKVLLVVGGVGSLCAWSLCLAAVVVGTAGNQKWDAVPFNVKTYWLPGLFAPFGASLRWQLGRLNTRPRFKGKFPMGTFIANVGATVIDAALLSATVMIDVWLTGTADEEERAASILLDVVSGFSGCLSTVSSWAGELIGLSSLSRTNAYFYGTASVFASLVPAILLYGSVFWHLL
uniref:Fluoride ion transporter CrcB n=1 Tax=Chromera velia CCMP2878 TaxID=1169474 RepID=A0A0G4GBL5_9ALVE|eukprot:Cvel_21135.t1-p1 / transcript=Cvel_21135.t1 / gene=Cvel_21135 / organism=Chromera_velia_CCMP2878 / gene_product=Protein CrcB homolog, putative / transcript_product=Protein CrcB homolog, putative / location=Cvel_scaffold1958:34291-35754(-) / protein_length=488 / sequence_SO=supercontig / SO=protein_coding / is_pseudo=false